MSDAKQPRINGNAKWLAGVVAAFLSSGGGVYWLSAPGARANADQVRIDKLEAKLDNADVTWRQSVDRRFDKLESSGQRQWRLLSKVAAKMRISDEEEEP